MVHCHYTGLDIKQGVMAGAQSFGWVGLLITCIYVAAKPLLTIAVFPRLLHSLTLKNTINFSVL